MPLILGTNSIKDTGYDVDNSLRFNDGSSDYLNRTTTSPNSDRKYTFSCWVKRSSLGKQFIIADYGSSSNFSEFGFNSADKLFAYQQDGGSTAFEVVTNRVFRDLSAWYHILYVFDSAQATDTNRIKFFVNGVEETSMSGTNYPNLNLDTRLNGNGRVYNIGQSGNNGNYFDGYLTEIVGLDNQALDPTSFGEFDSDSNIFKPIDVSGLTFGNNGYYLDFENSGSLGADVSGNGNNFTVNNLTSIDQTTDTCTNNFATLNGAFHKPNHTLANGNLDFANSGATWYYCPATIGASSGKWYCEIKVGTNTENEFGVCDLEYAVAQAVNGFTFLGSGNGSVGYQINNGQIAVESSSTSAFGNSLSVGDILQIALDMDNEYVYFGKNGTWQNSGDPTSGSSGTGGQALPHSGATYTFGVSAKANGQGKCNFGNPFETISSGNSDGNGYGNFEYAVPSSYYSLCTKNLAEYG